jgi:membrane protein YqaA with SNARE-associated domain
MAFAKGYCRSLAFTVRRATLNAASALPVAGPGLACYSFWPTRPTGCPMLRRFYSWLLENADKPYAIWLMAGISFAESSFFPLPPDFLLIPQMLADRRRVWMLATVATVSSVLGGFLGYAIGYWAFETVGTFIIDHFWNMAGFDKARAAFQIWGFKLIVLKGATPIPYKIVTILCGVLHYDLWKFALASIIARGMRFYLEAVLFYFFGEKARVFVEKRLALVLIVAAIVVVAGFIVLTHVHL